MRGVYVRDDPKDALNDVYVLTQKLLPLMNDGGRIVNISSGTTRIAFTGESAYAAAKGAIEVLTRYLAKELGPRRITANVVAPGPVQTDFSGGMVRDNPEINKLISGMTALGRPMSFYASAEKDSNQELEYTSENSQVTGFHYVLPTDFIPLMFMNFKTSQPCWMFMNLRLRR
jgi:NAD(P)-dependent dehydrogenase (short-subunit alcohol dehydrogenase family)